MLPAILVFASVYLSSANPDYIHFDDSDTACTTCVPIEECTDAIRALATRATSKQNFVREHGCGFRENEPLVCCDEFKVDVDKTTAISSQDSTKHMIIGSRNSMVPMGSSSNDDQLGYFDSYEDTYTDTNNQEMEKPIHRHHYHHDGYNHNKHYHGHKHHNGNNYHDGLDGFYYDHPNGFQYYKPNQFHGHGPESHGYQPKPSHGSLPARPHLRPPTPSLTTSVNSLDSSEDEDAIWIDVDSPNVDAPRPQVARDADEQLNAPRCGSSVQSRIVGGLTANDGQFPWVARLGYKKREPIEGPIWEDWTMLNFRCGATLVTSRHVLTAAHCLVRLPRNTYLSVVRVGSEGNSRDYAPLRTVAHASYDTPKLRHDIGIVQLKETVNFNGNVNTICLPFAPHNVDLPRLMRERNSLVVAGWGTTTLGSTANSLTLQWARMSLMEQKRCAGAYLATYNVSVGTEQLCAEPLQGIDACGGDSGGPLFRDVEAAGASGVRGSESTGRRAVLVGLVSFGPRRCGSPDHPGVYTNVAAYTTWIRENLNAT